MNREEPFFSGTMNILRALRNHGMGLVPERSRAALEIAEQHLQAHPEPDAKEEAPEPRNPQNTDMVAEDLRSCVTRTAQVALLRKVVQANPLSASAA